MSHGRRTALGLSLIVLAALGGAIGGATACGGSDGNEHAVAWVGRMRAASSEADAALGRRDDGAAQRALEQALIVAAPVGVAAEDRRVIRQDLHARLAELLLRRGDPAEAERIASRGLNEGAARDVFRASLLIARGRAREALGKDREAADDYYEALRIDEELLNGIMGGDQ